MSTKVTKDAARIAAIDAVAMPEARYWLAWHEQLIMQRESAQAIRAKYRATMQRRVAMLVSQGMTHEAATAKVQAIADAAHMATMDQLAASARQSRRDYEADRLDVTLRRPTNAADRGANGRARARCIDSVTGRDTSPKPFTGRAQYAVVNARANGNASYAASYDDSGVWLGEKAILRNADGSLTGYGALTELAQLAPHRPTPPDMAALARLAASEARAERAAELDNIARKARRIARHEGRKPRRGSRGRGRGRAKH